MDPQILDGLTESLRDDVRASLDGDRRECAESPGHAVVARHRLEAAEAAWCPECPRLVPAGSCLSVVEALMLDEPAQGPLDDLVLQPAHLDECRGDDARVAREDAGTTAVVRDCSVTQVASG